MHIHYFYNQGNRKKQICNRLYTPPPKDPPEFNSRLNWSWDLRTFETTGLSAISNKINLEIKKSSSR